MPRDAVRAEKVKAFDAATVLEIDTRRAGDRLEPTESGWVTVSERDARVLAP